MASIFQNHPRCADIAVHIAGWINDYLLAAAQFTFNLAVYANDTRGDVCGDAPVIANGEVVVLEVNRTFNGAGNDEILFAGDVTVNGNGRTQGGGLAAAAIRSGP